MICWAIRKVIPLYISEKDFFFGKSVENHINNCLYCKKNYDQYCNLQNVVSQKNDVPKEILNGYWDKIYSEISKERIEVFSKTPETNFRLRPILATAALILICFALIVINPLSSKKENYVPLKSIQTSSQISTEFFTNINKVKYDSVLLDIKDITEYELDQVKLITSNDVSF